MSDSLRIPSYRLHKPSGQAVVTIGGKEVYLGKWNTAASKREYKRVIGEYLARGASASPQGDATVAELCLLYHKFARKYYRKDGKQTSTLTKIKLADQPLAPGAVEIENRIDDPSPIERRPVGPGSLGRQVANELPLSVRQITGIMRAHRYGSVFLDWKIQQAES